MNKITEVKKECSVLLDDVFNYMERTVAVCFVKSFSQLEKNWEEAQFELSREYQYEGVNEHVWDFYLVFCCEFSEDDLDKRLRFKIEGDRFCCRKHLLFDTQKKSYSRDGLLDRLFPTIKPSNPIKLITTESILSQLGEEVRELIPPSFFTDEMSDSEINSLLKSLISRQGIRDAE